MSRTGKDAGSWPVWLFAFATLVGPFLFLATCLILDVGRGKPLSETPVDSNSQNPTTSIRHSGPLQKYFQQYGFLAKQLKRPNCTIHPAGGSPTMSTFAPRTENGYDNSVLV